MTKEMNIYTHAYLDNVAFSTAVSFIFACGYKKVDNYMYHVYKDIMPRSILFAGDGTT